MRVMRSFILGIFYTFLIFIFYEPLISSDTVFFFVSLKDDKKETTFYIDTFDIKTGVEKLSLEQLNEDR